MPHQSSRSRCSDDSQNPRCPLVANRSVVEVNALRDGVSRSDCPQARCVSGGRWRSGRGLSPGIMGRATWADTSWLGADCGPGYGADLGWEATQEQVCTIVGFASVLWHSDRCPTPDSRWARSEQLGRGSRFVCTYLDGPIYREVLFLRGCGERRCRFDGSWFRSVWRRRCGGCTRVGGRG